MRGSKKNLESGWEKPISDEKVREKTGRTWDDWIAALDAAGADGKTHKEIVAIVAEKFGIGPWWQQMVTVGYEQAKGMREKHETTEGYQVGASKTVALPIDRLYALWDDVKTRKQWLGDPELTVSKATPNKSIRIKWADGSRVDVLFYPKGDAKSYVSVDQRKLPDAAAVERQRTFWKERLEKMKELGEG